MKKIKLGVIGPGSIFSSVMLDLPQCEYVELVAVASRDGEKAKEIAKRYGAKKAYGSYEAMLKDPEVELVYVATPHNFHMEHTLMSLEAGKHVICEKPLAVNAAEARRMAEKAREKGLFLMEAMWSRFFPAMQKLKESLSEGVIGKVCHLSADFCYAGSPNPLGRVLNPHLAGGALLDVGIYPISIAAFLLGIEEKCTSIMHFSETGVDARTTSVLRYAGGVTAQYLCGVDADSPGCLSILGTEGRLEVPHFWRPTEINILKDGTWEKLDFPPENRGYRHEFDAAAKCILQGMTESPVIPLEESVRLMETLDGIRRECGLRYPME